MSSARKGMEVETQHDQECADLREGDIINLSDLIFDENRDYLVKYNKQQVCTLSTWNVSLQIINMVYVVHILM